MANKQANDNGAEKEASNNQEVKLEAAKDNSKMEQTMYFRVNKEDELNPKDVLLTVYDALEEKGYNSINQLVGFLISGDPAYITSHKQARSLIRRVERDDLIEELVVHYLKDLATKDKA